MTTISPSDRMRAALKEVVVPALRTRGFRGSFPHFRREHSDRIDLLMFQFSQWGPAFYVELGSCPPNGRRHENPKYDAPPDRVRVFHLAPHERHRLGAVPPLRDHAFDFGPDQQPLNAADICMQRAQEIIALLDQQAEGWWAGEGRWQP